MNEKNGINISGSGGDVFGVGVSGTGHIIGKNISVGEISINKNTYNKLEPEFRKSLEDFVNLINIKSGHLTEEQRKLLKEEIEKLAKEYEGLKADEVRKG